MKFKQGEIVKIGQYLEEIKARCDAATEGLVVEEHNCRFDITNGEYLPKQRLFYAESMSREDAYFFAHARTDVPKLLDMFELTKETLDCALLSLSEKDDEQAMDMAENYKKNIQAIAEGET